MDIETHILAILNLNCPLDASHQVSAQCHLRFGRRCHLNNFKIVTIDGYNDAHPGHQNAMILLILNLHIAPTLPTKFQLNQTYDSEDVPNVKVNNR